MDLSLKETAMRMGEDKDPEMIRMVTTGGLPVAYGSEIDSKVTESLH